MHRSILADLGRGIGGINFLFTSAHYAGHGTSLPLQREHCGQIEKISTRLKYRQKHNPKINVNIKGNDTKDHADHLLQHVYCLSR